MTTAYYLGVDVGTASTKGVLVDAAGAILARADTEHATSTPAPGHYEQDAEQVWWHDVGSVLTQLRAADADAFAAVDVVAFSGLGPCLLPCDAQLRSLRPGILYGIDARAEAEIDELTQRFGAERILRSGGSALSSQAVGPKLAWLARHEPDGWARTVYLHTAHSYLVHRLTGRYVLDHHSASQFDPLYRMGHHDWHPGWWRELAGDRPRPELAWPGEVVGQVSAAAADETGLRAGTRVVAGTIDAWAEATSVGVHRPGELMLMYGSTMFLVLGADVVQPGPEFWSTAGVLPGSVTYAAGMSTSGSLIRWISDITATSFADGAARAAQVPPGADGLLCLPYFAGERSPLFDPAARGVLIGLTLGHDVGHLFRAAYEAVSFGVRHNLDVLAGRGIRPGRVVAVGGGVADGTWTQAVSDVTGLAQQVPRVTVGAAYGDAMLAASAAGVAPLAQLASSDGWVAVDHVVEPDVALRELYAERYRLYRELGPALTPFSHALAAQQGRLS